MLVSSKKNITDNNNMIKNMQYVYKYFLFFNVLIINFIIIYIKKYK
jgi:hypothetical protein